MNFPQKQSRNSLNRFYLFQLRYIASPHIGNTAVISSMILMAIKEELGILIDRKVHHKMTLCQCFLTLSHLMPLIKEQHNPKKCTQSFTQTILWVFSCQLAGERFHLRNLWLMSIRSIQCAFHGEIL